MTQELINRLIYQNVPCFSGERTVLWINISRQIQIQFIVLVARRLKIKKLNKQWCTVQQNNTRQEMQCNAMEKKNQGEWYRPRPIGISEGRDIRHMSYTCERTSRKVGSKREQRSLTAGLCDCSSPSNGITPWGISTAATSTITVILMTHSCYL